jgi:hypothetical protein
MDVGNPEVRPLVLSIGVDRIECNFEKIREQAGNCFEL